MPGTISNLLMRSLVESPLHGLLGDGFAVITVHGRKTGRTYSTPVNVDRHGDAYDVISMRSRTWWRNLRGGACAELLVAGKRLPVRAQVVEQFDDVAAGLEDYVRRHPNHAKYLVQTGAGGQVSRSEMQRAAGERVLIRLEKTDVGGPEPAAR